MSGFDFPADDFDAPREGWHMDPRDHDPRDEETRQAEFLRDLKKRAPSIDVFAIPNGGKRTRWQAAKAKREGMAKGAPDLVVTWNYGTAFIEFKAGATYPDADQRHVLNRLYRNGHRVAVVRTSASAFERLAEWGAPV